jgi:hypothetical protein
LGALLHAAACGDGCERVSFMMSSFIQPFLLSSTIYSHHFDLHPVQPPATSISFYLPAHPPTYQSTPSLFFLYTQRVSKIRIPNAKPSYPFLCSKFLGLFFSSFAKRGAIPFLLSVPLSWSLHRVLQMDG